MQVSWCVNASRENCSTPLVLESCPGLCGTCSGPPVGAVPTRGPGATTPPSSAATLLPESCRYDPLLYYHPPNVGFAIGGALGKAVVGTAGVCGSQCLLNVACVAFQWDQASRICGLKSALENVTTKRPWHRRYTVYAKLPAAELRRMEYLEEACSNPVNTALGAASVTSTSTPTATTARASMPITTVSGTVTITKTTFPSDLKDPPVCTHFTAKDCKDSEAISAQLAQYTRSTCIRLCDPVARSLTTTPERTITPTQLTATAASTLATAPDTSTTSPGTHECRGVDPLSCLFLERSDCNTATSVSATFAQFVAKFCPVLCSTCVVSSTTTRTAAQKNPCYLLDGRCRSASECINLGHLPVFGPLGTECKREQDPS